MQIDEQLQIGENSFKIFKAVSDREQDRNLTFRGAGEQYFM